MILGSLITLYLMTALMLALILMALPTKGWEVALGAGLWPVLLAIIVALIVIEKITERKWNRRNGF